MAKQTIIVMSDSHGDRAIVEEIRNHYIGKVDAIFHNGDSELPSDDEVWQGIQVVAGNMDFYDGYPERLVTDLARTIIAQTHGHLFVNKYSNGSDSFSVRYQKTYGILPNKYAIRGFDLTMDAVLRLGVSSNLNRLVVK